MLKRGRLEPWHTSQISLLPRDNCRARYRDPAFSSDQHGKEVIADCKTVMMKNSAIDRANMAAFMNVSDAKMPSTFCNRFYSAIAGGRILRMPIL